MTQRENECEQEQVCISSKYDDKLSQFSDTLSQENEQYYSVKEISEFLIPLVDSVLK